MKTSHDAGVPARLAFGTQAQALRTALRFTQADAAARLGMSTRKLAALERGEIGCKPYERAGILRMYAELLEAASART